jgi:DNA repair photolyase
MPVLPFIEDTVENIRQIVTRAHEAGASYIIPSFGMSLRDRQRDYYFDKLDTLFPGLRGAYEKRFGLQYRAPANNESDLEKVLLELCDRYQITTRIPQFAAKRGRQIPLFN